MSPRCLPHRKSVDILKVPGLDGDDQILKTRRNTPLRNIMIRLLLINVATMVFVRYLGSHFANIFEPLCKRITPAFQRDAMLFGIEGMGYRYDNYYFLLVCVSFCTIYSIAWSMRWARVSKQIWKRGYVHETAGSQLFIFAAGEGLLGAIMMFNLPGIEHGSYDRFIKSNIYIYVFIMSEIAFAMIIVSTRLIYLARDIRTQNIGL